MSAQPYSPQSFMDTLSDGDRAAVLDAGHPRQWERGEVLIRAGDPADSAIVLTEGLVKIHKLGTDGAEVVLGLSGPGDLLGEISAVGDALRSATVTAAESVQAVVLAAPDLRGFLTAHPQATLALLALALRRLYAADDRRIEFATAESLARVSSRLIELTDRFGRTADGDVIEVPMPISQEELASWSAASKESTARALRTLRDLGVIETQRMRLTVLNLERLRSHAARVR